MNLLIVALLTLFTSCTLSYLVSTKMTYSLFRSFANLNFEYKQDVLTERKNFFCTTIKYSIIIIGLSYISTKPALYLFFLFSIILRNLENLGKIYEKLQKKIIIMRMFIALIFLFLFLNFC